MDLTGNSTTNNANNYINGSANIKSSTSLNRINKLDRPTSFNAGFTKNVLLSAYSSQQQQQQKQQLGMTSVTVDSSGINSSLTSTPMSICGDGYDEEHGMYNSNECGHKHQQQNQPMISMNHQSQQKQHGVENRGVMFADKSPTMSKKTTSTSISLNSLQNIQPVGKLSFILK
jgi:hypothetical protein